ncbi:Cytosolic sulfotransferase 15 [Linum perenne]
MPTSSNKEQGEENLISLECQKLLLSLPREKGWRTPYIYKFQGFWCQPKQIQAILAFQAHFQVKDTDVIVATIPKSGTTWLKALVFAITNRNRFPEEAFEMYCKGVVGYGPFWEHMLGYWNESQERPEKVLFFKYEDMKEDVGSHVRKLAEFLGCPFSKGEEEEGLVGEIARLKGEVGDWVNHLSPWMVDKLAQVMDEKLGGSGLKFKTFNS